MIDSTTPAPVRARGPRNQSSSYFTVMSPVMPGCTVQTYLTSPAWSSFAVKVSPLLNSSDLNEAPDSATALCWIESSLTQQTVSPTEAVAVSGSNLVSTILIVTAPFGQADDEAPPPPSSPPQPATATRPTTSARSARIERGIES